jgi:hypothetical protein
MLSPAFRVRHSGRASLARRANTRPTHGGGHRDRSDLPVRVVPLLCRPTVRVRSRCWRNSRPAPRSGSSWPTGNLAVVSAGLPAPAAFRRFRPTGLPSCRSAVRVEMPNPKINTQDWVLPFAPRRAGFYFLALAASRFLVSTASLATYFLGSFLKSFTQFLQQNLIVWPS